MRTIFILSNNDYSKSNGAAISRIYNYARALTVSGDTRVFLVSFKLNKKLDISNETLKSTFVLGRPSQVTNRKLIVLKNVFYYISSFIFLINLIKTITKCNYKPDAFIVFSMRLCDDILILFIIKFFLGCRTICEKNELFYTILSNLQTPNNYFKRFTFFIRLPFRFGIRFLNDLMVIFYDGVIAISTNILEWVYRYNKNVVLIPILTTDVITINPNLSFKSTEFKIGYAGTLSIMKDGIKDLIISIHLLAVAGTNLKLNLYGFGSKEDLAIINRLIVEYSLLKYITIKGSWPIELINQELLNHDLLVIPRPKSKQAFYGFSTKLAEYLATGIPVLATDVGDNKNYLIDGYNAYILSVLTPENLANKIKEIIFTETNTRNQVGLNGLNTAMHSFHFSAHTKTLNRII